MSESSLSDSTILRESTFSPPDEKGRAQLKFKLPSGRVVTSSDWLVPAEVKGKVLIAWTNAIRAEDAFDIQERAEREVLARAERRTRELSSAAAPASTAPAPGQPSSAPSGSSGTSPAGTSKSSSVLSLPDDPRELIEAKLRDLRIEAAAVGDQLDALRSREVTIDASINRWVAVLFALPSPIPSLPRSETDTEASGTAPASVEPGPSRSSQASTRTPSARRKRRRLRENSSEASPQSEDSNQVGDRVSGESVSAHAQGSVQLDGEDGDRF